MYLVAIIQQLLYRVSSVTFKLAGRLGVFLLHTRLTLQPAQLQ